MKSKVNDATMVVSPEIVSCDDTVCDPCELPAGELDDVSGAGPLLFVAAAALAVAAGAYVAKDTGSAVAGAIADNRAGDQPRACSGTSTNAVTEGQMVIGDRR